VRPPTPWCSAPPTGDRHRPPHPERPGDRRRCPRRPPCSPCSAVPQPLGPILSVAVLVVGAVLVWVPVPVMGTTVAAPSPSWPLPLASRPLVAGPDVATMRAGRGGVGRRGARRGRAPQRGGARRDAVLPAGQRRLRRLHRRPVARALRDDARRRAALLPAARPGRPARPARPVRRRHRLHLPPGSPIDRVAWYERTAPDLADIMWDHFHGHPYAGERVDDQAGARLRPPAARPPPPWRRCTTWCSPCGSTRTRPARRCAALAAATRGRCASCTTTSASSPRASPPTARCALRRSHPRGVRSYDARGVRPGVAQRPAIPSAARTVPSSPGRRARSTTPTATSRTLRCTAPSRSSSGPASAGGCCSSCH
jgi:hypothetical protein